MIKMRNTYIHTYVHTSEYMYIHIMYIKKHKQCKTSRFFTIGNNNIIHADQQDRQWKQYSLFSVYQIDEHEKYKS